jgi:hypothetical protein
MSVWPEAKTSNPYGVCIVARPTVGTGSVDSAQIVRSYQSRSNSGRGNPKTSVTMPSSNADMPPYNTTVTRGPDPRRSRIVAMAEY